VIALAFSGLLVGSFLNVVAHRLPRGESLVRPRSRCPQCGTQLRAIDNVPVLSWLALRGRCHHCSAPISARYPLVELLTAALYAAVIASQDDAAHIVLGLLLVTALVPITLIDLERRIIPNLITGPAALAAVVAIAALDTDFLPEALIAGAAGGGFFLVAAILYPRGMGMGDVKLAGMLGLYLGRAVAPAIFIALIAGVVVGAAVIARKGAKEIDAAVRFHAQDQLPMPLDHAVLDHRQLEVVNDETGRRLRILLVAARREMVERVLAALRSAGLKPEGVDLSAFAMVRALHRGGPEGEQVLYLAIGGLTNLAVARGTVCSFARASGSGVEALAVDLAERCQLTLEHAHGWLSHVGVEAPIEEIEGDE